MCKYEDSAICPTKKNMKNLLVAFGFLMLFMACETPIYFDEPQPTNGKTEKGFDKKYIGRYQSTIEKGAFLDIEKDKVTGEWFWEVEKTKAALDTLDGYVWKGDALFYYDKLQNTTVKGDTVIINGNSTEVLFAIGKDGVLKKYQKMYFLNHRFNSGWEVKKLHLATNDKLILSEISTKEEMEYLQQVTNIDSVMVDDTSNNVHYYKANPSEKEFEAIMNGSFFKVEEVYVRVK
jgi:hypothetical protein